MALQDGLQDSLTQLPKESAEIYTLATSGKFTEAAPAYAAVHDLFMWDSRRNLFKQSIVHGSCGRYGGPTRLPRLPLPPEDECKMSIDIAKALAFYSK
ncbi:MAG: hypothetical protein WDO06_00005 [Actinomycetota bacterium]